jgi:hypothetical protein
MSIIQSFVAVWTELGTFLTSIWTSLLSLFYAEGSLTFVGVMAVIMAGIALILLAFNLIRSFFAMRG